MTTVTRSQTLFAEAQACFPGGVNSPVRAFKGVDGVPRFMQRGDGAYLFDVDGNRYIDFVLSWGPLALGHAHPKVIHSICETAEKGTSFGASTELEIKLAQCIKTQMPHIEMMRFVSSGTEATMSALRLARAYTGRTKLIKFAGGYHGHADPFLAVAGSGLVTLGIPDSPGVPNSVTADTLILNFNDKEALENAFIQHQGEIAAVFVEPVPANMGVLPLDADFLHTIQNLCLANGTLFVLDEVITGFRVSLGGAQQLYNLKPDLTCLGKVIGGGLPVAAYGGKKSIMESMAPCGPVYQAGTLSGNPLSMAAGIATIQALCEPGIFEQMCTRTEELVHGFEEIANQHQIPLQIKAYGSLLGFFFLNQHTPSSQPINDYSSAKRYVDTERYKRFFHFMLEAGFYFAPSAYEAAFLSNAHTQEHVAACLKAFGDFAQSENK